MLLHYLVKLKIQIFCRYSADMEENANKLHLCINFNSSMPRPPNSWQFLTSQKSFLRIKSCFCAQCNIEEAKNNHCQEISVCYRGWGVVGGSIVLHQGHQGRSVFRQASGVRDTGCESADHLTEAYYRVNVYYPATDSVSSDIQL